MRMPMRFGCIALAVFLAFLAELEGASDPTASVSDLHLPIAFTVLPLDSPHGGDVGAKAAYQYLQHPQMKLFVFHNAPLNNPTFGTGFVGWLRDKHHHAIVSSIKNTYDIDEFVVDARTGKIAATPTKCVRSGCSWGNTSYKAASYIDAPQVVYDKDDPRRILKYIFLARESDSSHVETSGLVWTVDERGNPLNRPYIATSHGCTVSPSGEYLACESPSADTSCQNGIRILKAPDGAHGACVRRSQECVNGAAIGYWSPDSKGFAYYSQSNEGKGCDADSFPQLDSRNGWVVYYRLGSDPMKFHPDQAFQLTADLSPSQRHNWSPGRFCFGLGMDDGFMRCKQLLTGLGTEPMAWTDDSHYLYFSAVDRSQPQPYARMLGSISIANDDDGALKIGQFRPLLARQLLASGYAAVSPSGTRISLLGSSTLADPRAQLFVYNRNSHKLIQLTHTIGRKQIYAPHWHPN